MKIISIGGASRSGSTLLTLLLGQVEGCFAVGELRYVWSRGYRDNRLCGCGTPFRECDFWRAAFDEAYGGLDRVPIDEIEALHLSVAEIQQLPRLLSSARGSRFSARLAAYTGHLSRLCRSISYVSGVDTIIDSSKLPSYCYLFTLLPGVDADLIHLVRDSRAVAFSFMRKRRRPDVYMRDDYMVQFAPAKSAFDWSALNLAMGLVKSRLDRSPLIRYEDLVHDPHAQLNRLFPSLLRSTGDLITDESFELATNHTVSGNPVRMAQGMMEIKEDIEWRERMQKADRRLVTMLTWPLLVRYGYVTATASRRAERGDHAQRHAALVPRESDSEEA